MSVTYDFHGKTAFVTGAASGIGRATALAFARSRARIALADLSVDGLRETARLIDAAGGEALTLTCDVTRKDDVQAAVDRTMERLGRLDATFNNAGVEQPVQPAADTAKDDWDRILGVSLTGAFLCTRAQIQQMLQQDGGGPEAGSVPRAIGLPRGGLRHLGGCAGHGADAPGGRPRPSTAAQLGEQHRLLRADW